LSVQPRTTNDKSGESPDEIGERIAKEIESKLPDPLPVKKTDNPNSLDIFKSQEVERFNKLLKVMKKTLVDLQKAIKGTVVMSIELENMFTAFLNKKVPENWEYHAYPSLKPLGSWTVDLIERVAFFRKWVEKGTMESYWLSAFFFPQGFMTSAMQSYARKTMIAIDSLMFRTEVRTFTKDDIREVPSEGVNIHGLFL
jgi:dynein heavy chain